MPKRKGFLYEWMCDKEHIREAIVFGAKDKHDRRDVRRVLADVDGFTDRVYDLLKTQTFAPAQPKKRKIFDNSSRKWREIEYVPFFPDGIVHTLMVLAAAPVFLRGMNYWCCASVPGRGAASVSFTTTKKEAGTSAKWTFTTSTILSTAAS